MNCLPNAPAWLSRRALALIVFCALISPAAPFAQGVTTGGLNGVVTDAQLKPVSGATVVALHVPSGTTYEGVTRADGRYTVPGMRVGGPYSVTIARGPTTTAAFEPQTQNDVLINLGVATDLDFAVRSIAEEVTVTAQSDTVFSSDRTGAATVLSRETLASLPTIGGRLNDMTRLTPQSGGGLSFAGQDSRLNNITVDGSSFNNSFGLGSSPGDRTGVAPISLAAIEQVQVSIAPFDVRQGNFVGASVNTVTRSGTNSIRGSFYHQFRDNSGVGTKAKKLTVDPGTFNFRNTGGWASGPIIPSKTFFFVNYENESFTQPGTIFRANTGTEQVQGNVTRAIDSQLVALSAFLKNSFDYDTGPFQGYDHETPAKRFLVKVDHNLNSRNKLSVRYNHLDSWTDVLVSNSSSLGFGTRRAPNTNGLNFQNSNYQILENIRSVVGEWNSIINDRTANSLIVGYTYQDESRNSRGEFFPFVDILKDGSTYTSFGFEPFTPNNELRYKTFQVQNNFTRFGNKHTWNFGATAERYVSENVFFQGAQSIYVYNSLDDFYADANGYLTNRNRTAAAVPYDRFQVGFLNFPGLDKPIQPLEVLYAGAYAQDDWRVLPNLKVNLGFRFDVPHFGDTGYPNALADAMTFRDEGGNAVQYKTGDLPDPNILWSPRLGFNWDVNSDRKTQVRGGTGVFTGRPAYVWISNQVGNTGILTGLIDARGAATVNYPFSPDPSRHKPTTVTGAPAASYPLAVTNQDFKFPQLWRTNIGLDQRLPWGWTGTVEYLYNRDVNGIYYNNANLPAPQTTFTGADNRPRYTSNRINSAVTTAIVLKNQDIGRSWNIATSAEKTLSRGLWVKTAYSYGESKNTIDPGSIAAGSWQNNPQAGDPNNPSLAFSSTSPGHRFFIGASYTKDYFKWGGTTVSAFWESRTIGNGSYTFATDMNGDTGANDLVYVPRDQSEMNFTQFTSGGRTFIPAEQAAAFDAYISQDKYLSTRRGQYAERGMVWLPMVHRLDFSIAQNAFVNLVGKRNTFQFRVDVDNFANLLNSDWGVGQRLVAPFGQLLTNPTTDSQGRSAYRLRAVNTATGTELIKNTFETTAGISDVYRVMFSVRYTFN